MLTFNFQMRRLLAGTVSEQLPQFNVVAVGFYEAKQKASLILGVTLLPDTYTYVGEVTDGVDVWDFETGLLL